MKVLSVELPASALRAAGNVNALRVFAWLIAAALVITAIALGATPWQQSVRGSGRVIAYAPLERQQAVEAPIAGRVVHWYVQEGDRVSAGAPIADLSDNDPEILARLRRERDSARKQTDAADVSIVLTEARVASLVAARDSAVANANLRVQMARDRRDAAAQAVDAAEARLQTARLNLDRQTSLHDKGLASRRELELAQLEAETARTERDRGRANLRGAKAEVEALRAERAGIEASNQASIDATRSSIQKLEADKAKSDAELAKVEVRLARQEQMKVVAPRDETILRLVANQGAEMVEAGDPIVLLVPASEALAVELYVDGNDAPLVDPNRPVRLQFEGWPAVQFVGWPSAAVGTFGGHVAFVDSHGDGNGQFRVVVVPAEGEAWPSGRFLRQGVRANGWVLLNRVSLGFELWRQFNGFPPVVDGPAEAGR